MLSKRERRALLVYARWWRGSNVPISDEVWRVAYRIVNRAEQLGASTRADVAESLAFDGTAVRR